MSFAARFPLLLVTLVFALARVVAHTAGIGNFAGLVEIGGDRKIYLECRGEGSPTVALISGKGDRADTWSTPSPDVPGPTVFPAAGWDTRARKHNDHVGRFIVPLFAKSLI